MTKWHQLMTVEMEYHVDISDHTINACRFLKRRAFSYTNSGSICCSVVVCLVCPQRQRKGNIWIPQTKQIYMSVSIFISYAACLVSK